MRVLVLSFLLMTSSLLEASTTWRLDKEEEGIKVFLRDTAGSALQSFKGTMTVDESLHSVLSVIEDIDSYTRWVHNCRSAKILKQTGENQIINYIVTDMPWPVIDRDAVIEATRTQNKNNKRVEIKLFAKPKYSPNVAGKVRIEKLQGRWLLTPVSKDKINVVYEMSIDPGGSIPKWVVNSMAVDLPFNTLKKLRSISKEDKYANAKVKGIEGFGE